MYHYIYIYNNTTNQYSKEVTQKNLKFLEKLLTKSKSNWEHLNNIFFITFILLSFLFYFLIMLSIPRENIWSSKWYHDILQNKTSQHLQPQIQMIGVIVVVETTMQFQGASNLFLGVVYLYLWHQYMSASRLHTMQDLIAGILEGFLTFARNTSLNFERRKKEYIF